MRNNKNYIGINQRIPLKVLEQAFELVLTTGKLDKDFLIEQLSITFKGKNRINKAYLIIKKIFSDNKSAKSLTNNFKDSTVIKKEEKYALFLALMASSFPFVFNLVQTLATIFKIQDECNSKLIMSKMSNLYGSNRATEIAVYSVIPLLKEMHLIKRVKPGLYNKDEIFDIENVNIIQYYLSAYLNCMKTKSFSADDIKNHPWFFFFKPDKLNIDTGKIKISIFNKE